MAGVLYSFYVSSSLLPATGNTANSSRIQGCCCQYSLSCLSSNSVHEYGRRHLEHVCPSTLHVSLSPPIHHRLQSRYSHRGQKQCRGAQYCDYCLFGTGSSEVLQNLRCYLDRSPVTAVKALQAGAIYNIWAIWFISTGKARLAGCRPSRTELPH